MIMGFEFSKFFISYELLRYKNKKLDTKIKIFEKFESGSWIKLWKYVVGLIQIIKYYSQLELKLIS